MTSLLEQLIAIPSVSREEKAVADFLEDRLQDLHPRRHGNNLWMVKGEGPVLLLDAHIDTVKPVAGWQRDPFTPTREEDRIYGLGANDDGGSVVSMIEAFRKAQPLRHTLVYLCRPMKRAPERTAWKACFRSLRPMRALSAAASWANPRGCRWP
jgi:acetylornithine deacetylase